MSGRYGTPYTETEVLLAVLNENLMEARRMLREALTAHERTIYRKQLTTLVNLIDVVDAEEGR